MTRKAFEFKKTYEEVELAGNTYKVDFSDEKIREYNKHLEEFQKESKRIQDIKIAELAADEQNDLFTEMRDLVKGLTETLLGKETFEDLYEKSGDSLTNMMEMLSYLGDIIQEYTRKLQDGRMQKYLANKKRN